MQRATTTIPLSVAGTLFSAGLFLGISGTWLALKHFSIATLEPLTPEAKNETSKHKEITELEHEIHVLETPTAESLSQKQPEHDQELPAHLIEMIPLREKQVLAFILTYIQERKLGIPSILVNGGYVRDLLLGKIPDDLDISLCLRDCAADVTVERILEDLEGFPLEHAEFDIVEVKSTTIVSDESKNKQIDTAKATIKMKCSTTVEVDLMPTIGSESYDDKNNRIPVRDHRGTPMEDALRRDLTIGCLFLSVTLTPSKGLRWVLLDYYGGLPDLESKVLRSPYPANIPSEELVQQVIRTKQDCLLWNDLSLEKVFLDQYGMKLEVSWDEATNSTSVSCTQVGQRETGDDHPCQPIWWIKVLEDDPLRIVRTFRFAGKLGFGIHPSFWTAIPFALDSLKTKVAGSRKYTEMIKLAKLGKDRMLQLFYLAFVQTFHGPHGKREDRLATYLFGGNDANQVAHYMDPIVSFDWVLFVSLFELVPLSLKALSTSQQGTARSAPDALLGVLLSLAICCCKFDESSTAQQNEAARQSTKMKEKLKGRPLLLQFNRCVEGLCGSNDMRGAGEDILNAWYWLLELSRNPKQVWGFANVFQHALPAGAAHEGITLSTLCARWEVLKLGKTPHHYSHQLLVKLLQYSDHVVATSVRESFSVLRRAGPALKGSCLLGMTKEQVPQHLRGNMITALEVFARCIEFTGSIQSTEELLEWLRKYPVQPDGLSIVDALVNEWHEPTSDDSRVLKHQYSLSSLKGRHGSKPKKGKKGKKE